ncbi:MAG: beta-N-acetylhexosaminidase [Myxococcota bacterium]|jgi:beta-N-acetylhexosaminidase|nr:beta-N-acetylhexosaminidase [Deltaproteobacteria bacterium]MCP4239742.1 beta-N-acetylhexosaminidase [bacterium]MDP6074460.1 beta-N-acetylhexosaminidase [Myxococcota bacterium]MDP6241704.1 beta-N-acetylhexosaminidase [Myxococcota bacterium]MDP7073845.1 beta-N-acetylhexosaminidase [Myxococcota bacterium]
MGAWRPGQLLFAGFEGTRAPRDLLGLVREGRVGGVILFARNLEGPEQVRQLVAEFHASAPAAHPLMVAIDQEGGRVQRLRAPWTEWPPMRTVGEHDRPSHTRALGTALGRELADLGIGLDFAPVVDVDTNPDNPVIGDRSFAGTAEAVGRHAAALIAGLQGTGVAACAKHFPGHGDTQVDSHKELPRVAHAIERLRAVELPPFRAAIEADVASVMTAHVVMEALDPELPATLSPKVLGLLRHEIGFDGVVFSDDLEMAAVANHHTPGDAVRLALEAGCDALLTCCRTDVRNATLAALEALPDRLLEHPARRIAALKARYGGGTKSSDVLPPYAAHTELASQLSG